MMISEQNTTATKKFMGVSSDRVLQGNADTIYIPYIQDYIIILSEPIEEQLVGSSATTRSKYPKEEENMNIETRIDFFSFAESLFPNGRLFNKEEQAKFKEIRDEIFKEI